MSEDESFVIICSASTTDFISSAHAAGARADAVSFQTAVTSDSAVLAILVIGILGLVVILAISAPSLAEAQAQARRDRLREFELENERAQIMLDAKRLQMQQLEKPRKILFF